eukprot:TRINITY_DN61446_c0_g1_i1.p1 TRINITY_DN61446_c0_g1~~TRINITY_DN61446_c0_g1_i1.p1  ORF type:complete len:357 (-),score=60.53 TRINITY_DN61446_c0_g1_i1:62-1132(-)
MSLSSRGAPAWHAVHSNFFGEDRWERLMEALHRDHEHLCIPNPFLSVTDREDLNRDFALQETNIPFAYSFDLPPEGSPSRCRAADCGEEHAIFVEPESVGRLSPMFFLDGASILVAHALEVQPEDRVLDACAAPGGKSLVLALAMFAEKFRREEDPFVYGRLVCNDASKQRSMRMQRTIMEFLPGALFDAGRTHGPHVVFTAVDVGTPANTMERHGPYDKILFDSPCISDRQLLRDGESGRLGAWSAGSVKVSSEKQLKWLNNALWLLKEGGILVYCTTALSRDECDGVVEKLLTKTRGCFELDVLPLAQEICRMVPFHAAENTDWGTRVLPDSTPFGPVYFSRIRLLRRLHHAVQ